jgi:hypothetical protein
MNVSVVLATYNQPQWPEKVLWGYAVQSHRDFQLVIADDGSGPETDAVIERARTGTHMDLVHVWHADRGFRKCEIPNRAIVVADGDYLIFSDGDCIPREDFVITHMRSAEPDRFLSGGYLMLPPASGSDATRSSPAGWRISHGCAFRAGSPVAGLCGCCATTGSPHCSTGSRRPDPVGTDTTPRPGRRRS